MESLLWQVTGLHGLVPSSFCNSIVSLNVHVMLVAAGSHRQHALYIWDKATGSLVKMLTGQKGETLLDIVVSRNDGKSTALVHITHAASLPSLLLPPPSLLPPLPPLPSSTLLQWHPVRPVILSISTGVVNVWSQAHVELWSAYAPNFKELDENEEYEEKEDEFDIVRALDLWGKLLSCLLYIIQS